MDNSLARIDVKKNPKTGKVLILIVVDNSLARIRGEVSKWTEESESLL